MKSRIHAALWVGALALFLIVGSLGSFSTSLELEVSPDGSNWYDHTISGTLLADSAADATGYIGTIAANGFYWRVVANVSNTNTLTPDLKMVLR